MATYAIGDIQGCFGTFQQLLQKIAFDPAQDRLWLVGDLVNRGPRSLETLRFVRDLRSAAITVLGNHDLSLLITAAGFRDCGRSDTFSDVLNAPDREDLLGWLRRQRLCHVTGEAPDYQAHADAVPKARIWRQAAKARECRVLTPAVHPHAAQPPHFRRGAEFVQPRGNIRAVYKPAVLWE